MRRGVVVLVVALAARAATAFETADPLHAFVFGTYPRGEDYFVHGRRDTTLLRCVTDLDDDGGPDVALSEISIWGNRTGPFEVFAPASRGRFRYVRTADYGSVLQGRCADRVESCRSKAYLASGRCRWTRSFQPK